MRICFVSLSAYGYFNPDVGYTGGGAQRQFSMLARRLTDAFDVHFIVGDYGQPQQQTIDGVTLHRAYSPQSDASINIRLRQLAQLYRAMKTANADVYLTRSNPRKAMAVFLLSQLIGAKHIFHIGHDNNLIRPISTYSPHALWIYQQMLSQSAAVVCQTNKQHKILSDHYHISGVQIPNGYPIAENTPPYDNREFFLWVGRLSQESKRPHLYLDLAEANPNHQFLLIGPDGQNKAYNQRIQQRACNLNNVQYLNSVPPDAINKYYRRAIALISTSAAEGFPNVFLEAWRVGTPTLSLSIDLNRYVTDAGELYAADDPNNMNKILHKLYDNPGVSRKYGQELQRQFEEKYSMVTVAERYSSLLHRI